MASEISLAVIKSDLMQNNFIINHRHISDLTLWRLVFRFILNYGGIRDTQALLGLIYQQLLSNITFVKHQILASKKSPTTGSSIFDSETVLESVLSYLDFKSLCKVSTLNKNWFKLATSEAVWERLIYNDFNVYPKLSYKYSHIGAGRSKDFYCYSLRLFKYSVYGFGKKGGNAK